VGETSSNFRDTLLELIETSPEPVEHPSPDQWIAYQRGELPAGEETRLQEHLARCRDCFDLAAAAAELAQPDEEPAAGQQVETAALWRLLWSRLDSASRQTRATSAGPRRPPSWRSRLPYALAASLFVALVGLGAWSVHQQSVLDALRAPQPNARIFDFAAGERLSAPASAERIISAPTGPWMLVLHPAEELPAYRLTLRDAATGKTLWSVELRLDEDFALTLQLPEGLRPGRYRLELSDSSGRVLETHRLRVTRPGMGG
jgi:Putative zinc-finger